MQKRWIGMLRGGVVDKNGIEHDAGRNYVVGAGMQCREHPVDDTCVGPALDDRPQHVGIGIHVDRRKSRVELLRQIDQGLAVRAAPHERHPLALEIGQRVDTGPGMAEHHAPVSDQALLAELEALRTFVAIGNPHQQIDLALVQADEQIVPGVGNVGDPPAFPIRHRTDDVDRDALGRHTGCCRDDGGIVGHADPDRSPARRGHCRRTRQQPE